MAGGNIWISYLRETTARASAPLVPRYCLSHARFTFIAADIFNDRSRSAENRLRKGVGMRLLASAEQNRAKISTLDF